MKKNYGRQASLQGDCNVASATFLDVAMVLCFAAGFCSFGIALGKGVALEKQQSEISCPGGDPGVGEDPADALAHAKNTRY